MGNFGKPWRGKVSGGRFYTEGNKASVHIPGKEYLELNTRGNARVKNARRVVNSEGIEFDSGLEMFMDGLLARSGMRYERQKVIVLQEGFRDCWTGKWVREIKWVADFWLPDIGWFVDTKGWGTEVFKIKYKLFQRGVYEGRLECSGVKFASTKGGCILVVEELKVLSRA